MQRSAHLSGLPTRPVLRGLSRPGRGRRGQAMIESLLMIFLISLVFCAILQISQVFAAKEILQHAAARGARAKSVGFNHWMVVKSMRVAAIPNCGNMLTPEINNGPSPLQAMVQNLSPGEIWDTVLNTTPDSAQLETELARIPEYLGAENEARGRYLLDYEHWDSLNVSIPAIPFDKEPVELTIHQRFPLWVPMHQAFYNSDELDLEGSSHIGCHYPLYLDDQDW